MKRFLQFLSIGIIALVIISCGSIRSSSDSKQGRLGVDATNGKDTTTYELIVFDPGFDFWLSGKTFSKKQYTNEYMQSMNNMYVIEWNRRYSMGDRRVGSYIDYDATTKYDLDFNYKLFMYFKYFEESYNIKLIAGSGKVF
jgi:hypothetical protein